ncbi:MAG: rod shape-determining protein [Firmicutes bacterium]|nr:rod shape-determining protein [Bacillota bacterium]
MFQFGIDVGIDLGTANTLVYVRGKGIVIREPSVVAVDAASNRILAIGSEARRMLGRTPGDILAVRPLQDGVIANYDVTESMLKHYVNRACGGRPWLRPRVVVCVPAGSTSVEKRAVMEACLSAGARKVYLVEEPVAAALGAGISIAQPSGSMVVDIGGGTTDVAVLSLGGIVASQSLKVGGNRLDEAIVRYARRKYSLLVGEQMAEEVKILVGTAWPDTEERTAELRGRDMVTGLPRTVRISSNEIYEAIEEHLEAIVEAIRSVLETTPPELAADVMDKGIVLTGGGALLRNMDRMVRDRTGVPAFVADDPMSCVALGTGRVLEGATGLHENLVWVSRSG